MGPSGEPRKSRIHRFEGWIRTMVVLWLAHGIAMASLAVVLPFLPLFLAELGVTEPARLRLWTGGAVAASFICMALADPLWGTLADRCGRKPMVVRSLWGVAIAIGLMSWAQTPHQLFALRCLQGGVGGVGAAGVTLMAGVAPPQHTGTAISLLLTANMIGSSVGPWVGGGWAERWGYRGLFLVTGGALGMVGVLVLLLVPERFDREAGRKNTEWRETFQVLRASPRLRWLLGIAGLTQMALLAAQSMTSLYVTQLAPRAGPRLVGLMFSAPGMANLLTSPLWGWASDRRGAGRVFFWALLGTAVFYAPQGAVRSAWQLLLCRVAVGLCTPGVNPTVSALVAREVPPEQVGRGLAWLNSVRNLGSAGGPLLAGSLAAWWGIAPVFWVVTGLLLVGAGGAWSLRKIAKPAM